MKQAFTALILLAASSSAVADLKVTNKMIVGRQEFGSTVFVKQGKVRSETSFMLGSSAVVIQDCSNHRMIQLNERARTYLMTNLGVNQEATNSDSGQSGTVTLDINQEDTGERKQFFGQTARHIKGIITSEGGSAACRSNFQVATDGWYIDIPATQGCAPAELEMLRNRMLRDGCDDSIGIKVSGVERLGYPVLLDTVIKEKQGDLTLHQETTDLLSASLDSGIFEVPAGYRRVQSYHDLVGLGTGGTSEGGALSPSTNTKKRTIRIGVTQVASRVSSSLSTDGMQQELVDDINFLGGQAVLVPADPHDREAALEQAKQQGCEYVVFTIINEFKTASVGQRLGSVLGRGSLGGVGGSGQGRVELNAEVKVFAPENATPVFEGDVNFRQNDADATARGLMHTEARNVMLEVRKLQGSR
jgi:hypothetical protein